ncbi:phosphatidylinositol transfer protein alpha isoform-like [Diadema antillarum]|uniref:phosphatidylinositol transfer protein alpha isoform-like n=1 Tax=Diadema antillarum TaxID=105358 RepID=UPI003A840596
MVFIKEFRILLPMTPDECRIGHLYAIDEASRDETGGGEGVEIVENVPFDATRFPDVHTISGQPKTAKGQYTHKIYHISSKVPAFIRLLAPKGSLEIHEKSWNCFPFVHTEISNPDYMKDGMKFMIDTIYAEGKGKEENIHELPPNLLSKRQIDFIDIANDPVSKTDYKEDEDPTKFTSEKTGRGPLVEDWKETQDPIMCCYKLVSFEFKWWGLQTKVESVMKRAERRLLLNLHRKLFCRMDQWHGMTIEDIRAMEEKTQRDLQKVPDHARYA